MSENESSGGPGFLQKLLGAFNAGKEFSLESLALLQKGGRELHGPLNGLLGDKLDNMKSPLALPMRIYRYTPEGFVAIDLDKDELKTLPDPGERLCIFVHGLGSSERTWLLRRKGQRAVSYAELLGRDTGHVCYFIRYNTGRHISKNGRELADLLNRFIKAYPVKVSEVNLIAHSMGGLVSRSAGYYGQQAGHGWVGKLTRQFLLGSPLLGAHQEQIGKLTTDILDAIPLPATRITAQVADLRSAGIQDLGYGYLRDEDWQEAEQERAKAIAAARPGASGGEEAKKEPTFLNRRNPVPLLKKTRYYLVIGSVSKDPDGIVAMFLGDGIVNRASARGVNNDERYENLAATDRFEVPGLPHTGIPGDPRVYRRIRDWLREGPESGGGFLSGLFGRG